VQALPAFVSQRCSQADHLGLALSLALKGIGGFRAITWVREFTDSMLICAVAVIAVMLGPSAIVWRALR